jgi:hypothetical protein
MVDGVIISVCSGLHLLPALSVLLMSLPVILPVLSHCSLLLLGSSQDDLLSFSHAVYLNPGQLTSHLFHKLFLNSKLLASFTEFHDTNCLFHSFIQKALRLFCTLESVLTMEDTQVNNKLGDMEHLEPRMM